MSLDVAPKHTFYKLDVACCRVRENDTGRLHSIEHALQQSLRRMNIQRCSDASNEPRSEDSSESVWGVFADDGNSGPLSKLVEQLLCYALDNDKDLSIGEFVTAAINCLQPGRLRRRSKLGEPVDDSYSIPREGRHDTEGLRLGGGCLRSIISIRLTNFTAWRRRGRSTLGRCLEGALWRETVKDCFGSAAVKTGTFLLPFGKRSDRDVLSSSVRPEVHENSTVASACITCITVASTVATRRGRGGIASSS